MALCAQKTKRAGSCEKERRLNARWAAMRDLEVIDSEPVADARAVFGSEMPAG